MINNMSTYTGDKIRKYRTEKGLTQKKLGELCGIADSNIRKYESGNQNPKIETIQKIANALEVNINELTSYKISTKDGNTYNSTSTNADLLSRKIELKNKLLSQYKTTLKYINSEIEDLSVEAKDLEHRIDKLSKEISQLEEKMRT